MQTNLKYTTIRYYNIPHTDQPSDIYSFINNCTKYKHWLQCQLLSVEYQALFTRKKYNLYSSIVVITLWQIHATLLKDTDSKCSTAP